MSDYNNIDWEKHNYRNLDSRRNYKPQPNIDREVSDIVGRKVLANDPRLAKLCMKWRGNKPVDGKDKPDNNLKNPDRIKELKKVLG